MNLLNETLEILQEHGKTEADVLWVGSQDYHSTWEHFKNISNINYDSGYGSPKIATDLLVVGENWWLERHEYDGSEWWEYKTIPNKPEIKYDFKHVGGGMWDSLKELNDKDENNEF